ncbi:hypothetical protein CEXT_67211 [Caerostris extrusa]|uniref:Uncharacterized protein n=1 Tax=Caerostris extrusa TaxID=172846 RepID=A0AAV4SXJ5_CAEEX|nr:hypothetical protein CEXT_67211 [Caerostris extrusa]
MPEYPPLSVTQITPLRLANKRDIMKVLSGKWHLLVDYLFNKPLPPGMGKSFPLQRPSQRNDSTSKPQNIIR